MWDVFVAALALLLSEVSLLRTKSIPLFPLSLSSVRLVNLFGIESPGLTSSLSLAREVVHLLGAERGGGPRGAVSLFSRNDR